MLVGAFGTGALAAVSTDRTEAQSESNEYALAMTRGEIRELEDQSWDEQDVADFQEQLELSVEQAHEKGLQVAEAQNSYQELLADLDDAERPEFGEDDVDGVYAPINELRKELVDLFDESARIVENEDSYYPGGHTLYQPGEVDVLDAWYSRLNEGSGTYAEPSLNSWELASVTPRDGSSTTVQVAWLNRDSASGDLLAWARATFNAETGMFHSVYVGETLIGELPVAGADSEED